jgi:hypothetical protein
MILHLHCSVPLGVPFYIRGSKRDINNCVLLLQMYLPCGLNTELLEVKNVSAVKFMSPVFLIRKNILIRIKNKKN